MIFRPRGSVTIPRVPRGVGNLLRWSREVNQCLQQLRDRVVITRPGGGKSGASGPVDCPFGELETNTEDPPVTSIRGGIIYCGDQTWNMDPQALNLEADGVWLVSIEIAVEVNRDDDNELLLPGIKTGTRPTGDWEKTVWTTGTDYPDNESPEASDGLGTIHVPIGKLTIADGVATFSRAGCGNIVVGHCAGTLAHTRS